MPFWISRYEGYDVLFIMENPYRTELNFTAQPDLSFLYPIGIQRLILKNQYIPYLCDGG